MKYEKRREEEQDFKENEDNMEVIRRKKKRAYVEDLIVLAMEAAMWEGRCLFPLWQERR